MRFEPVLKKVLVPTDGSASSQAAQESAATIAKVFKSRVTVIHVIPPELASLENEYAWLITGRSQIPQGGAYRSSEPPPPDLIRIYDEIKNSLYKKGEEILEKAVAFFKQEGVSVDEKLLEDGDTAAAIMKEVHEGSYDLAVMGRQEDVGKEPHLGSTAEKVTRHSEIPVLIVGSTTQITKILVCFDGSQNAEKALQYAAYLAKSLQARMTIIHVHHPELLNSRPEQAREAESRILSRASEILGETALDKRTETGDPARVIVETAKKEKYDLIVMGSKGHSGFEKFLLGSVSEHVIHYADTSVLLVR